MTSNPVDIRSEEKVVLLKLGQLSLIFLCLVPVNVAAAEHSLSWRPPWVVQACDVVVRKPG